MNNKKTLEFYGLGTSNQITLYDDGYQSAFDHALAKVREIESRLSVFRPNSEIARLNEQAGIRPVIMSPETLKLFEYALHMKQKSGGAFDITTGPLIRLWGIGKKQDFIPCQSQIEECRSLVHSTKIQIDPENHTAYLPHPEQSVDLGGIAKGYAADEVKKILLAYGVKRATINLGGNIITIGEKEQGIPWTIGIQNPLAPTGTYVGTIKVTDATIVTSGTNERFFLKDGVRYHHLLDPRTGIPARSGLLSVTVVSSNSMEADALTTALFILGMKEGTKLLQEKEAEAIFLTEDGQIYTTEGLRDNFSQ